MRKMIVSILLAATAMLALPAVAEDFKLMDAQVDAVQVELTAPATVVLTESGIDAAISEAVITTDQPLITRVSELMSFRLDGVVPNASNTTAGIDCTPPDDWGYVNCTVTTHEK